ncbi:MAG: hypothetical protein HY924_07445 [Elusimicrobia bacterium]|nr:hypothetical protein [Elusimicrobiota bacterium]
MKIAWAVGLGLAAGAWASASGRQAGGAMPQADPALRYQAFCERQSGTFVTGSVLNTSGEDYVVDGFVSFGFETERYMTFPGLTVFATAFIPAGKKIQVAQASLPFSLEPRDRCVFDVSGAIGKL